MHELWEPLEYVGETLVFLGVVGEVYVEWRVNGAEFNGMVPSGIELWVNREYPAAHSLQGILANAGLHPRLKPDAGMVSGTMILFVGVKPHPNK